MKGLIAIIDSSAAFRNEADEHIQRAGYDTACYASPQAFLLAGLQVDCVVCAIGSQRSSGLDLLRTFHDSRDFRPFVCVARQADVELALLAGQLGAKAFLVRPVSGRWLVQALSSALGAGKSPTGADRELRERYSNLTTRQQQTMVLLLQGLGNKDIAARLKISSRTVEIYRAAVMTKMDATSLVQLVRIGMRLGIT